MLALFCGFELSLSGVAYATTSFGSVTADSTPTISWVAASPATTGLIGYQFVETHTGSGAGTATFVLPPNVLSYTPCILANGSNNFSVAEITLVAGVKTVGTAQNIKASGQQNASCSSTATA